MTDRAVVLARGLGTRMRREDAAVALDSPQEAAVMAGWKPLIPFAGGRPFLDWVLSSLADAGCREVCLVIGPEQRALRRRYEGEARPIRVTLAFAEQAAPLGTADAVLAAERFAAGGSVLLVNADNLYPVEVLRALRQAGAAAVAGYQREGLLAEGDIPPDRIRAFAFLEVSGDGLLTRIVEKPDDAELAALGPNPLVSMNSWVLPPGIYDACRRVTPSRRGELELADAVRLAVAAGERFRVLVVRASVLDLSTRSDIATVAARLAHREARP